jgi:hypothetical protein
MKSIHFALACTIVASAVFADVRPVDVGRLSRDATRVFVARVTDVQSRFATNTFGDRVIVSDVRGNVLETLKGRAARTMTTTVEGGTVGSVTLTVSTIPILRTGDRAVFFLKTNNRGGVLKLDGADRVVGSNLSLRQMRGAVQ